MQGGKTLVLKTVALVCLMTSYGLFVHHEGKSTVPIVDNIFIDIGDQQSLENSLSTFSGHMQNIAEILAKVSSNSLVLFDEIGSGTEPNEGAALAIAIMEAIYQKGALLIATTHYGEIKEFALRHADFQTAAMAFDAKTLTPQYRLLLNQVGSSNAFWIAEKMKVSPKILRNAQVYLTDKNYQITKQYFTNKKVAEEQPQKMIFNKGDRILYTETKQSGLFYEYLNDFTGVIFIEKKQLVVPLKCLKRLAKQEGLYPAGYDLESLFVDYELRKFNKDIDRGSKKAQKQLRKSAEKREEQ